MGSAAEVKSILAPSAFKGTFIAVGDDEVIIQTAPSIASGSLPRADIALQPEGNVRIQAQSHTINPTARGRRPNVNETW